MGRPHRTVFYAESKLNLRTTEALFFINEALFDATQEIVGFDTVETAKEMAPVLKDATKEREPGELRDSIDAKVTRIAAGKKSGVRARITTSCGYGGYVEKGTAKMSPEPFLWPAFEQNIQRLPEKVRENLGSYVSNGNPDTSSGGEGETE